jgi:Flp pilus assembly protein TadD
LDISAARQERTYIKISLGVMFGIILLIFAGWGGRHAYVRWQEKRWVERAAAYLQKGDTRSASLALRTVIQLKPSSVPANRLMADLADSMHDKSSLEWRRRVNALAPNSAEDLIAWARSAILYNDFSTAEHAMQQVPDSASDLASFHAAKALIAQHQGHVAVAESEWREAVRRAPSDNSYRLQLGVLQLRSNDAALHSAGERTLRELLKDPQQRVAAARALISDNVARHASTHDLLELAHNLQSYPEARLPDKLVYLDFLHQLDDPGFVSYLTQLEKSTQSNPTELGTLISWMSRNNLNLLALDFAKTAPPAALDKWPVPLAIAEVYLRLSEWKKLQTECENRNWAQFDFLRHAYLAHALRAQDKAAAAEHEWAASVKASSGDSEMTLALLKTVADWKWKEEMVELFWALSKYPERQNEAFQNLYQYYARNNDTQGLHRVLLRLAEIDPANSDVQNNLAQVSLLLNAQPEEARRIAAEIYQKKPSNAAYATTYAYGLLTSGKIREAEKVLNSLTSEQLRDPAVSAYYGICLAAANDPRAKEFLEIGQTATLLPEEKELVAKALDRLGYAANHAAAEKSTN